MFVALGRKASGNKWLTKGSVRKLMPSMERMAVAVPICVIPIALLKVEDGMVGTEGWCFLG